MIERLSLSNLLPCNHMEKCKSINPDDKELNSTLITQNKQVKENLTVGWKTKEWPNISLRELTIWSYFLIFWEIKPLGDSGNCGKIIERHREIMVTWSRIICDQKLMDSGQRGIDAKYKGKNWGQGISGCLQARCLQWLSISISWSSDTLLWGRWPWREIK